MATSQSQTYGPYPWYTRCIDWDSYTPLNLSLIIGLVAGGAAALVGSLFLGPWGVIGIVAGSVSMMSGIISLFNYMLYGKLVCLGEENAIVCGTVTHLEPPQRSALADFLNWMDNDYSWNLLVCPYKTIERVDSTGNPVLDPNPANVNTDKRFFDPEPFPVPPAPPGALDYYCLEAWQITKLRAKYPNNYTQGGSNLGGTGVVAPNVFEQKDNSTVNIPGAGVVNPANLYFEFLSQSANVQPLPGPFPFTVPLDSSGNAIPLLGQGDTPSGRAYGFNPGLNNTFTMYPQSVGTTGLSAQIHCEIEGARMINTKTGAIVGASIISMGALVALAIAIGIGIGWALLALLIAFLIGAAIALIVAAASNDPNVTGGNEGDTIPNSGTEGTITNTLSLHVGDFVIVVGRWVFDMFHCPGSGSNEIHPVKQVYVPTTKITETDFCTTFYKQVTPIINNSTSKTVIENQKLPENGWHVYPLLDGCGNYDPAPIIP